MTATVDGVEGARPVGDGERRGPTAFDQLGQQFVAHRTRGGGHQRGNGEEDRAEDRSAGQRRTEFLDRDGLVDSVPPTPPSASGTERPRTPSSVPRRVHAFGSKGGSDSMSRRTVCLVEVLGAELANRLAQFGLLFGERELDAQRSLG